MNATEKKLSQTIENLLSACTAAIEIMIAYQSSLKSVQCGKALDKLQESVKKAREGVNNAT